MSKQFDIAIVGATTAVGEALVELLTEHKFPVAEFFPLDHEDEAGGRIEFNNKQHLINDVAKFDFSKARLVFFVADTSISENYVPKAAEAGCIVIDRTPAFRNVDRIPLVVSGVNSELIKGAKVVTNPCCIATALTKVLNPVHDSAGINALNISTYQAVSGAGKAGLEEVGFQTAALLNFKEMKAKVFPHQIAFNVIPQIGAFTEIGYTLEEMKIINETRKILNDDAMHINVTAVRVPVFYGHSISISVETRDSTSVSEVKAMLARLPGIEVTDQDDFNEYPTPVTDAANQETIYVGRIRQQPGVDNRFELWITADNIRACAANNMLAIAEQLISNNL
jgi:aspartate-semialdehyde dehydrogenase